MDDGFFVPDPKSYYRYYLATVKQRNNCPINNDEPWFIYVIDLLILFEIFYHIYMNTPPLNNLIRNDIDMFWSNRLGLVRSVADVRLFVCEYLPLLGIDYDTSIAKAVLQLQRINVAETQPLVTEIAALAKLIYNEGNTNARLKLWRRLAKTVGYDKEINKIDINLTSRSNVIKYIKVLLSDDCMKMWPAHDIAYKIVNLMVHYDITEDDRPLYEIWDLATEVEAMSLAEIEISGKLDETIKLSKKLG